MSSASRTDVASALHELVLSDPDGAPVALADHRAAPLVVVTPRYFGCLPCQAFMKELDERATELPDGAGVLAVAGSADHQARWLREEQGVRMPLLLDPEQRVRTLLGFGDLTALQMANVKGLKSYVDAVRNGWRVQQPTNDALKSPGLAVLGPDFELLWAHEGSRLGDYPPVDEVLATVRRFAAA